MKDAVKLANFRTKTEAEAAAGLLKSAGIPYLIQSAEGMLHGPLFPGATIYVPPEALDHARSILGLAESDSDHDDTF